MYRRSLLVIVLCIAPLRLAAAADVSPVDRFVPYAPAAPFVTNWTGFYLGAHVGAAFQSTTWTDPFSQSTISPSFTGFMGGLQLGYNLQANALVFGLEGDFSGTTLNTNAAETSGYTYSTKTDWTASIAGKLGYAFDRLLLYGKGGIAFAQQYESITDPFGNSDSAGYPMRTGWTAGAGVEYALDANWSARIAYDYMNFGSQTFLFTGSVLSPAGLAFGPISATASNVRIQQISLGANFRF